MPCFDIREPSIDALKIAPVYFRYGSNKKRILVDALTANAILAVYSALSGESKAKVQRFLDTPSGLYKLAGLAFKYVKMA